MSFGLGSILLIVFAVGILYNILKARKNPKWSKKRQMFAIWMNIFAFLIILVRLVLLTLTGE